MPIATLVKVSPMDTATGSRVDLYLSNMGDADMGARVNGLGGNVWVPALTASPVLSMRTWNGDFTAAVEPGEARLAFTLGPVKRRVPAVESYYWAGAPIEVYAEEVGTAWPWTARFVGNVRDYAGAKRKWTITAAVDERRFARNILTATYAGTGGIEGGDSLKGKVKPLVLGWATNVEPVLIDAVNNVYQFSGYGAIEAVTTLYERGSAFPASTGDYANYTALVAASIPNGGWGTCLASGLIRLGAPQFGVITGDVKGHKVGASTPRLPGSVISALATIAGVSSGDLNATSLTAFDTGVPYPINLFIDGQVEFADMAREIALSCNWVAGISLKGKFFAAPVSLSPSAAVTLNAQGAAKPQVIDTSEKSVSLPYWKTIMGAARVWRVHSTDEIAFTEEITVTGYLTKESANLPASSAGVVSDFSPANGTFKVIQGQIDRTTSSTFSLVSAIGATATINATSGVYSVSAMSADSATVTFQAVYNGVTLTKVLSLTKAKTGAAGASGVSPVLVTLSPATATVQLNADGTATGLPIGFTVYAARAGASVTVTSVSVSSSSGGSFSVSGATVSLDSLSGGATDAYAILQVVADGDTISNITLPISTARAGAGTGSVAMAVGPTLTQANASSYGQVGVDLAINASTTGKLKLNLTGYVRPDIEDYKYDWKIQYSTNGGTSWTDVSGMPITSGLTTLNLSGNIVGGLSLTTGPYTVTGLGASTPCLVRVLLQKSTGSATAVSPVSTNLTLTAEQVA